MIEKHRKDFGLRRLLRRLNIFPNAYDNYRKADYYAQKSKAQTPLRELYHEYNGVDGSRTLQSKLT